MIACPAAAKSKWVRDEVAWWLANRPVKRMLIAWTDGDLTWEDHDFDWTRTGAVPRELSGKFASEPIWADLRSLRPRTSAAAKLQLGDLVADFAAPIRGMDKDDLVGEHITQRRRTRFTVVAAVAALTALAVAASAFAVDANHQAAQARAGQRAAVHQSHLAQSDEVAAEAMSLFSANVPLAMLLSLQAYERAPTLPARSALIEAAGQPLSDLLAEGSIVDTVAFSPDGHTLAVGDYGGHVGLWDTSSGQRTASLAEGSPVDGVAFSQTLTVGDAGGDAVLWDAGDGQRTATLAEGAPVDGVAFSRDGQTLAIGDLNGDVALLRQSLWHLTGGFLSGLICGEVRENMTRAQWAANAPGQPYQRTCSAYP